MSLVDSYPEVEFDQVVNDLLIFSLQFISISDRLLNHAGAKEEPDSHQVETPDEDPSEAFLAHLPLESLIEDVLRGLSRAKDMITPIEQAGYANAGKVGEIAVLFKLFDLFDMSPETVMERLCANPHAFLVPLRAIFSGLKTNRPLTIESALAASFRAHKINRDEAQKILNLRCATIRRLWRTSLAAARKRLAEKLAESQAQRREQLRLAGRHYTHLTEAERQYIMLARCEGHLQCEIALALDRDKGTISREVRRLDRGSPGPFANYDSRKAVEDYRMRRKACGKKTKHEMKNKEGKTLYSVIRDNIKGKDWSPEMLYHRILLNSEEPYFRASISTIYRWINSGIIYNLSREDLRRKGKPYKKCYNYRNKFAKGRSITERSDKINDRSEFGHFEADSVVSCHGGSWRLFTIVERKTRFLFAKLVETGTAENFVDYVRELVKKHGNIIKSITVDNGPEFSLWKELEDMGIEVYFARPYCSNDKGTIENHNGLIREYFPKGTDFSTVSPQVLSMLCLRRINNRPKKVLDWLTPQEAWNYELGRLNSPDAA